MIGTRDAGEGPWLDSTASSIEYEFLSAIVISSLRGVMVTNLLIRGLSDLAVQRIDAEAAALGLSRNEFLRRRLEVVAAQPADATLTARDWRRSAATFGDLVDPAVMDAAWR